MTKNDLALNIGTQILNQFDKWLKDSAGRSLVTSVEIPRSKHAFEVHIKYPRFENWTIGVEISAPRLLISTAPKKFKVIGVSEYLKIIDGLRRGDL